MDKAVEPRFRTQGSWSYDTCIQPAALPPQEMDWDFGVYLPVTVWEENGPPHAMAKRYFTLVEGLLDDLCKQRGWELVSGKDTCIRVQVSTWAHIDIPLYAAPESEFLKVVEKAALAAQLREGLGFSVKRGDEESPQQTWDDLEHIAMATRAGVWRKSDPEEISKWFRDRLLQHTEQLRRVCRFLKAWRDFHWKDGGGPTSVSIMVAVAQSFEVCQGRDDIALERAARRLAQALLGEIRETAIANGEEDFNSRMKDLEKQDASAKAQVLADHLHRARLLNVGKEVSAIALVVAQLGERVPDRCELIHADDGSDIRTIPARTVPQPVVPSTRAG